MTNRVGPDRATGSDSVTRSSVTASTTAAVAVNANAKRIQVTLFNGGSVAVYVGSSAVSTTSYEVQLQPLDLYVEDVDLGALYVRTASSTAAVYIKETT